MRRPYTVARIRTGVARPAQQQQQQQQQLAACAAQMLNMLRLRRTNWRNGGGASHSISSTPTDRQTDRQTDL